MGHTYTILKCVAIKSIRWQRCARSARRGLQKIFYKVLGVIRIRHVNLSSYRHPSLQVSFTCRLHHRLHGTPCIGTTDWKAFLWFLPFHLFLPHDAMHKRGLCRRAVSVWLGVCLSRSCIVSKRLKIRPCWLFSFYGMRIGNRIPKLSNATIANDVEWSLNPDFRRTPLYTSLFIMIESTEQKVRWMSQ